MAVVVWHNETQPAKPGNVIIIFFIIHKMQEERIYSCVERNTKLNKKRSVIKNQISSEDSVVIL